MRNAFVLKEYLERVLYHCGFVKGEGRFSTRLVPHRKTAMATIKRQAIDLLISLVFHLLFPQRAPLAHRCQAPACLKQTGE